jgi:hypothetical protein
MSMFGLPAGMNLGMLSGLFGSQQPMSVSPFGAQGGPNPQYQDAMGKYQKELSDLRKQAERAGRQLVGEASKNKKYLQESVGTATGQEQAQLRELLGNTVMPLGPQGMSPRSQYYTDMLPFVDRYNQLQDQYRAMGLRI